MYNSYHKMMRAQRRGTHGSDAKTWLLVLALAAMIGSAVHWWRIQSHLTADPLVAGAYTAILVLAPPILVSFLIPWSPGGMLLQKVHARTWGFIAVIGCSLYLLYYSFQIQWSWWAAQPVVFNTGLVYQQVLIGIIGFIIIPALLWTPVSDEELVEKVKQAHLVKRYEIQTAADIAILDVTLLRAQQKAAIGFANLTAGERVELADAQRQLLTGIDTTLQKIAGTLNQAAETVYGGEARDMFSAPAFTDDLAGVLEYVSAALSGMETHHNAPALVAPDDAQTREHGPGVSGRAGAVAASAQGAARRGAAPRYAAEYDAARAHIDAPMWNWRHLSPVIGDRPERTCRDIIAAWLEDGLVKKASNGFFSFTEVEA